MKLWSCCVVLAATACGGDKVTGPAPCDTYTGGIIGTGALPGSYALKSFCSGTKPDHAGASGDNITITGTDATGQFSASITGQGTYSGSYSTSPPNGITVHLTSPASTDLVGTYRLRNDSLAVSGTVTLTSQRLSLVGTRVP